MPALVNTIGLRAGLAVIGATVSLLVIVSAGSLRRIDKVALAPEGTALFRGVPIFAVLPEGVLEQLAHRSRVVTAKAGDVVFPEGSSGDLFYVIESGDVDVTIRGEHIRRLGPGESFGESALLRDIDRTATVTATTELVTRTLDRRRFLGAVTGHQDASNRADAVVTRLLEIR